MSGILRLFIDLEQTATNDAGGIKADSEKTFHVRIDEGLPTAPNSKGVYAIHDIDSFT